MRKPIALLALSLVACTGGDDTDRGVVWTLTGPLHADTPTACGGMPAEVRVVVTHAEEEVPVLAAAPTPIRGLPCEQALADQVVCRDADRWVTIDAIPGDPPFGSVDVSLPGSCHLVYDVDVTIEEG